MREILEKIVRTAEVILPELKHVEDIITAELRRMRGITHRRGMSDDEAAIYASSTATLATVGTNYVQIKNEPFIATVRVEEDGVEKLYLICRNYIPPTQPLIPNSLFVNRNATKGKVASAEVGKELLLTQRNRHGFLERQWRVKVLEKNIFRPKKIEEWDAVSNQFYLPEGIQSIESLRAFLEAQRSLEVRVDEVALIGELERAELKRIRDQLKIKEGIQQEVIEQLALRDRPILDENQDLILRLPLSSQLIVTGAPGTGKTTILVQRISLKSKVEFLEDEERTDRRGTSLSDDQLAELFDHQRNNWILFTPSDLLKVYLKEALNKEDVPAPDAKMKTWHTVRMELARPEYLNLTRVGSTGGPFQRSGQLLLPFKTNREWTHYAEQFHRHLFQTVQNRLGNAIRTLERNNPQSRFLDPIRSIQSSATNRNSGSGLSTIAYVASDLTSLRDQFLTLRENLATNFNEVTDTAIRRSGRIQEIGKLVAAQSAEREPVEAEEVEYEEEAEEENAFDTSEVSILARRRLRRAVVWYAERLAQNSPLPEHRQHSPILNLVLQSLPTSNEITPLGQTSLELRAISRLMEGYNGFFRLISDTYRLFRTQEVEHGRLQISPHARDGIRAEKISDEEIDILIYTQLQLARDIFLLNPQLLVATPANSFLEKIRDRYYTQVMVDEATDFSAIQLGCMYNLSHPYFDAVSLSGDLMQRATHYGITSWDDCKFFSSIFQTFSLSKVYRQSPRLLKVAQTLYMHSQQRSPEFYSAFGSASADIPPLIFDARNDTYLMCRWIVDRIVEIYQINKQHLPSIAIFVPEEGQIETIYALIREPLEDNSFLVEKCPEGKIGDGAKIRIFSVEYIKGLEFEGVFVLNIDYLEQISPDLIDKYLYVALTRAGHFLAATYNVRFPSSLDCIRDYFSDGNWSIFVSTTPSN